MLSPEGVEYEVVNQEIFLKRSQQEIEFRLDVLHKVARQIWAVMILLAQLDCGVRPNWKKK